jgi:hypothetical protein
MILIFSFQESFLLLPRFSELARDEVGVASIHGQHQRHHLPCHGERGPVAVALRCRSFSWSRASSSLYRGASLAASTSTCWICLFRCFEIGVRITLSAELFSALHSPQ